MNSIDLAVMGLKNLLRRKARTLLTVIGVVIGTTSIVVMISLGLGMEQAFTNQISEIGSLTNINVYPRYDGGSGSAGSNKTAFDDKLKQTFENMENVDYVLAFKEYSGEIVSGRYRAWARVVGVDFADLAKAEYKLSSGELPIDGSNNEVLWGAQISFYDPKSRNNFNNPPVVDPYKAKIEVLPVEVQGKRARGYQLNVTGVTETDNYDIATKVFVDLDSYEKFLKNFNRRYNIKNEDPRGRNKKLDKYNNMVVGVNEIDNVPQVQQAIKDAGFEAFSLNEILQQMRSITFVIQAVLGGIGAISMVVAAIGIANTMVMSIYERTREIGVMKVIGAQLSDIKRLFLFEASMIGIIGGVIGIVLSYGVGAIINNIFQNTTSADYMGLPLQSQMPLWLVLLGVGFSATVGLLSGYYPAVRATKLSALEAIRTE